MGSPLNARGPGGVARALARLWDELRSSMWFLPALFVIAGTGLAMALVAVDAALADGALDGLPLLFGAGAEGARGVLTAIAGSMITVAGVTFSITVVTLSLTATQYSPRVLRNFMRDRGNQSVLGVFVAVFAYCLVVLRVVRGDDGGEGGFVPELAVLGGVLLAFVAIGFLIYFVHHIATSIQAVSIVSAAAHETLDAVDRLFPQELGRPAADQARAEVPCPPGTTWQPVLARRTGYLLEVEAEALLALARERDTLVRMDHAPGDFVVAGTPLVSIALAEPPDEETARALGATHATGLQRSLRQDASFGVQQIVDVALKGLSPGVNDTTTALICVDYLGAILARAATRRAPDPVRTDEEGVVRVVARGPTFETLLGAALPDVCRNAAGNAVVLGRLLGAAETVAGVLADPGRIRALAAEVRRVATTAERSLADPLDRAAIAERRDRLLDALGEAG